MQFKIVSGDAFSATVYLPKGRPFMNLGGRPVDPIREAWKLRYGFSRRQAKRLVTSLLIQLSMCRSEEARRLILGVKEK